MIPYKKETMKIAKSPKIAIVGLGVIGKVHAEALREQGKEIYAVCDIDPARLSFVPEALHFTDYETMLREAKPDAVHICTPHYLHAPMILSALAKDIHVLSEKPLCIHREEIEEILAAEARSKAILGVCQQNRYKKANIFVKQYLENKKCENGYGTVVWERSDAYYQSGAWRGKWATEGGGALINQALHTMDLLQWMLGMPENVTATVSNIHNDPAVEVEDNAVCLFEGKAQFSLLTTTGAGFDYPVELVFRAEGETVRVLGDTVFINEKQVNFEENAQMFGKSCYGVGHSPLIRDFYDCIASGRPFPIDGKEAAKVIRMILSCYESKGQRILVK